MRGKINANLCGGGRFFGVRIVLLLTLVFGPSAVDSREGFELLTHQTLAASRDHMLLASGAI